MHIFYTIYKDKTWSTLYLNGKNLEIIHDAINMCFKVNATTLEIFAFFGFYSSLFLFTVKI